MYFPNWTEILDKVSMLWHRNDLILQFEKLPAHDLKALVSFVHSHLGSTLANIKSSDELVEYFVSCLGFTTDKNSVLSIKERVAGNKRFSLKDYKGAHLHYTASICHASWSSTEISLAVANRSAALFHLRRFKECIRDIEVALAVGYPEDKQYKLLRRRDDAHAQLSDTDRCDERGGGVIKQRNCSMSSADQCIQLCTSAQKGRHLIVTEDVDVGRVLLVEQPYAWVPLPRPDIQPVCHHCLQAVRDTPIPCRNCSVLYCTLECQRKDFNLFHRVECRFTQLIHSVGIAHLALRVTLTAGLSTLRDADAGRLDSDRQYNSDSYSSVFKLLTHQTRFNKLDLLNYTQTAVLLLWLLQLTDFFDDEGTDSKKQSTNESDEGKVRGVLKRKELSADELLVGSMLLRHILQLICNGQAVTQVCSLTSERSVLTEEHVRLGTALYPTTSLLNHSCRPNVFASFQGTRIVVKATERLRAGCEVLNCYGPHVARMSREQRLAELRSQYFFDCSCNDCTVDSRADPINGLLCERCGGCVNINNQTSTSTSAIRGTCVECGRHYDVRDKLKQVQKFQRSAELIDELFTRGKTQEAIELQASLLQAEEKLLFTCSRQLAQTRDRLASMLAETGDMNGAAKLLKNNLTYTSQRYGKNSVEMCSELHKLSSVLCACVRDQKTRDEALHTAQKAQQLVRLFFADNNDREQELQYIINQVQSLKL